MILYASHTLYDLYATSFPHEYLINSASDLHELARHTDYTMCRFKDGVNSQGIFEKNHKNSTCFLSCKVLFIDIDESIKIKDFEKKFEPYEYYLTTSRNHQIKKNGKAPEDRFHALFPLNNEIKDAQLLKELLRSLSRIFFEKRVIDGHCIDVARKFFGNVNNESIYNHGKGSIEGVLLPYVNEHGKINDPLKKDTVKKSISNNNKYCNANVHLSGNNRIPDTIKTIILDRLDKAYKGGRFYRYDDWVHLGITLKNCGFVVEDWFRYCHTKEDVELARVKWETFRYSSEGSKYLFEIIKNF